MIEGRIYSAFARVRDCLSLARLLCLCLPLTLFLFSPRTCYCCIGWLNICVLLLTISLSPSRYPTRVRKHADRRDPRSRRMAPTLVISPFLLPFSPRSVKRDVPARNDARARDWCTSSRCLPDPKPRILLPGFAPGAISACPSASDTNRSTSTRCLKSNDYSQTTFTF